MNNKTDKLELDKNNLNRHDLNRKQHWQQFYSQKQSTKVIWYQKHPECSLELIKATGVNQSASIIDIGGASQSFVYCRFIRV